MEYAKPTGTLPTPLVEYYGRLAHFALGCPVHDQRLELAVTDAEEAAQETFVRAYFGLADLKKRANYDKN